MVKEVVIMGGSAYARGNATPAAEANISNDPYAAQLVFSAGWPLTMVGLDVTTKTVMTPAYLAKLASAGNKATDFISRVLPLYQRFHDGVYGPTGEIHTHDPSAIAYLIDPTLFKTQSMPVFVETEGRCAGDTVPDPFHQWISEPNVNVCVDVDAPRLLDLYMKRLTK
jgi:purine nucleosidase